MLQSQYGTYFYIITESDSESDEGESGTFSYMKNRQDQWNIKKGAKSSPSKMCVSVNIGKGSGTLFCQLKVSFIYIYFSFFFRIFFLIYFCKGFIWQRQYDSPRRGPVHSRRRKVVFSDRF
jgi:hypothetical protein